MPIDIKEIHLIPVEGTSGLMDAVAYVIRGDARTHNLRKDQTVEEYFQEVEAGEVRLRLGLPPGRTMPTKEEIAAGPVPEPAPEPDPRDVKIADLEARLAALETAARKK